MKFVLELAAQLRSVIYVFGHENLSQQVICASESSITVFSSTIYSVFGASEFAEDTCEGLTWFSEGHDVFIFIHSLRV